MIGGPETMFGYLSVWHWAVFIAFVLAVAYPIGRILSRIGFSPLWSVLAFIPFVNLLALWVVALTPWPRDRDETA